MNLSLNAILSFTPTAQTRRILARQGIGPGPSGKVICEFFELCRVLGPELYEGMRATVGPIEVVDPRATAERVAA